jgi:hypothetical protein
LGNEEQLAFDILKTQVQFAFAVVKNAKLHYFPGHPKQLLFGIVPGNSNQSKDSFPDAAD